MMVERIQKMKLPKGSRTSTKVHKHSILDFDRRIRKDFRNTGQEWRTDVDIEAEFPAASIEDGYINFTNEDIRWCFDRVLMLIQTAIMKEILDIHTMRGNLKVRMGWLVSIIIR